MLYFEHKRVGTQGFQIHTWSHIQAGSIELGRLLVRALLEIGLHLWAEKPSVQRKLKFELKAEEWQFWKPDFIFTFLVLVSVQRGPTSPPVFLPELLEVNTIMFNIVIIIIIYEQLMASS